MNTREVSYQETVFSRWISLVPAAAGIAVAAIGAIGLVTAPFQETATGWWLIGTGGFILLVALNLLFMRVTISKKGITVRYGVFHSTIPMENVAAVYQDKTAGIVYGGYGVRFAFVKGRFRIAYMVLDAPRVVIRQKRGNREIAFSTRNLAAALGAIEILGAVPA